MTDDQGRDSEGPQGQGGWNSDDGSQEQQGGQGGDGPRWDQLTSVGRNPPTDRDTPPPPADYGMSIPRRDDSVE